jgi:hypothetical protein
MIILMDTKGNNQPAPANPSSPANQDVAKSSLRKDILYVLGFMIFGPISLLFMPDRFVISKDSVKQPSKTIVLLLSAFAFLVPSMLAYLIGTNVNLRVNNQPFSMMTLIVLWLILFFATSMILSPYIFPNLFIKIRTNKILFVVFILIFIASLRFIVSIFEKALPPFLSSLNTIDFIFFYSFMIVWCIFLFFKHRKDPTPGTRVAMMYLLFFIFISLFLIALFLFLSSLK